MLLHLPDNSTILADAAYTDYTLEEMLADNHIHLLAARKKSSRQPHEPFVAYLINSGRKQVETAFSDIAKDMPKAIHAVTAKGFLIKLIAFIFGCTIDKVFKTT